MIMKTKFFSFYALMAIFLVVSCGKNDDDDDTGTIVIEVPDDTDTQDPVFIAADPDINTGTLTFEQTGPSFALENA